MLVGEKFIRKIGSKQTISHYLLVYFAGQMTGDAVANLRPRRKFDQSISSEAVRLAFVVVGLDTNKLW